MPSILNEVYASPNLICVQLGAKYSLVYNENKWRFQKSKFWDIIMKQYRCERHVDYFSDPSNPIRIDIYKQTICAEDYYSIPFLLNAGFFYFLFLSIILCVYILVS